MVVYLGFLCPGFFLNFIRDDVLKFINNKLICFSHAKSPSVDVALDINTIYMCLSFEYKIWQSKKHYLANSW